MPLPHPSHATPTPHPLFPLTAHQSPTKLQLELVQTGLRQFALAHTAFSRFPLSTQLQTPANDWLLRAAGGTLH